jgi:putative colanic acid biosynthesis acetyltransferase WcaF
MEAPYMGQDSRSGYSKGEVARRLLWYAVQATLFRWSPRRLHGIRIGLLRLFGADIPAPGTTRIFPTATVHFPWKLALAPRSMIGPGVTVLNIAPITLGRGANVSQNCHLCSGTHDYNRWSMPLVAKPIVIGDNVWICADAFVGPGVTIGELCVVGARSVVVRDLPPRKVCVGNPCRPVKDRLPPAEP